MSATPTEMHDQLAGRLSARGDGERVTIRIDVRAATVRYVDGVFELSLPKSALPVFLHEV